MKKLKKIAATIMMACMLLTFTTVSSNTGIMPYGGKIIINEKELK